jgi:DNA primase
MEENAKYLIHADVTAEGVVERSDVVGAIFGQTEGLLGDDLDLRDLQQSSRVGRIDVEVASENGQSFGRITIASSLDRVETAILAAALETAERVGPCRATISVEKIEDVRAAKRREVVERAKALLGEFDGSVMSSQELIEAVRESARVVDIARYEGLPAGPQVADSDAVVVVEGRADVLALLRAGVKNAIAVEGTNVPAAVAELTRSRTVTAFLDGDRGGDLILKELAQVGTIDHVAVAPEGQSVEDLSRKAVLSALREKVPYESVAEATSPREAVAATDGSTRPAPESDADEEPASPTSPATTSDPEPSAGGARPGPAGAPTTEDTTPDGATPGETATDDGAGSIDGAGETKSEPDHTGSDDTGDTAVRADGATEGPSANAGTAKPTEPVEPAAPPEPETLRGHVRAVVEGEAGRVRLLDAEFGTLAEAPAGEAFDAIAEAETAPAAVVLDGELPQRVLDVAAQRGIEQIVARSEGEFVKQPTGVRVRTVEQLRPD